jgi:hypothetical protein
MTCEHLIDLEREVMARGIPEISRGQAWSRNCREWVYFRCYFERESIRKRFNLSDCVIDHQHAGTHDGKEAGFYCTEHQDGILGVPISDAKGGVLIYR